MLFKDSTDEDATPVETPKAKQQHMDAKIEELIFERIGEIKEAINVRVTELREDIMELHADVRAIQNAQQQHGIAVAQLQGQFATLQVQHETHQRRCEERFEGHSERIKQLGKLVDDREISQVHIHPIHEPASIAPVVGIAAMSHPRTDTGVEKRLEKIEKVSAEDLQWKAQIRGAWKVVAGIAAAVVVIYGAIISTYSVMRHSQGNEPKTVVVTLDQINRSLQAQSSKDNAGKAVSFPMPAFVQLPGVDAATAPLEPQFVDKPTRKPIK